MMNVMIMTSLFLQGAIQFTAGFVQTCAPLTPSEVRQTGIVNASRKVPPQVNPTVKLHSVSHAETISQVLVLHLAILPSGLSMPLQEKWTKVRKSASHTLILTTTKRTFSRRLRW